MLNINPVVKSLIVSMFLASGACHAASKSASTKRAASTNHYIERTCTFGKYGPITVHEGGVKDTYITVKGKKYPSNGGGFFVTSNDDVNVAVMFDRKGNPSYQGEIPGRNCRVIHG